MSNLLVAQVVEKLNRLPDDLQHRVLEFVDGLTDTTQRGRPGGQLLRFVGAIPAEDLQTMGQAIEAGCEQVDAHEW